MHPTAITNFEHFVNTYVKSGSASPRRLRLIEIGSLDVNGSLRSIAPSEIEYIGVDFSAGRGVDVVITDPYALPFEPESADIVVSSSCFEHSQMFWLLFLEIMRITKETGLFYLNVPSNGSIHRFPVDCWRFYPDSGEALVEWGKRNHLNPCLLESYTSIQINCEWNDYVAIFLKNAGYTSLYPRRVIDSIKDVFNGVAHDRQGVLNETSLPEDKQKMESIVRIVNNGLKV